MPSIQDNLMKWEEYDWSKSGEEWSATWGTSDAQWFGGILPRIHSFLPAGCILEIAPGFGRWTRYLMNWCDHLIGVDLSSRCIDACKMRFSTFSQASFYVNDGKSLEMIQDQSIDFAFSFDSLVHVGADIIDAYLGQLAKKLKPDGVGFLHHSNLRMYSRQIALAASVPSRARSFLIRRGLLTDYAAHWRDASMDASIFERCCRRVALVCIGQELVNWGGKHLGDAFSMFTPQDSIWARPNRILRNPDFMTEAVLIGRWSTLYGLSSFSVRNEKNASLQS